VSALIPPPLAEDLERIASLRASLPLTAPSSALPSDLLNAMSGPASEWLDLLSSIQSLHQPALLESPLFTISPELRSRLDAASESAAAVSAQNSADEAQADALLDDYFSVVNMVNQALVTLDEEISEHERRRAEKSD
jgi:hypothetical protein